MNRAGDGMASPSRLHREGRLCLHTTSQSASQTRPGCGSQRLLRCRSHPAGRGPNSSSLFPPLAAVVAVAPSRGASGEEAKLYEMPKPPLGRGGGTASAVTERLSLARASRSGCPLYNLSVCFADSSPSRGASGEEAKFYEMLRPSLGRSNSSKRNPTPAHSTIRANKNAADGSEAVSGVLHLFSQQRSMDQALASLLCSAFL